MYSISIKGYKSFKDITVRLNPINILIGSNGAGKSNFLSLFELLGNAYEGFLQEASLNLEEWTNCFIMEGKLLTESLLKPGMAIHPMPWI